MGPRKQTGISLWLSSLRTSKHLVDLFPHMPLEPCATKRHEAARSCPPSHSKSVVESMYNHDPLSFSWIPIQPECQFSHAISCSFLYCLSLLQKRSVFFISLHVRGWEPGCVCQMHCVAFTPAVPCLMIWYLEEREIVRRKICSVPWTLGFGHFSWRQPLAASFLITTSLFSGREINLYSKTQGFVARCLRGSFSPQWSFLGEFVISLGIGLNASGLRFSFEVYFMFCCGFQISHGLDLGK